jgi:DNA-binding NtrC family response regulator
LLPDLCLLDMNFSVGATGEDGLRLLRELKALHPDLPVILITAWGTVPLAVEGMKAGAVDFITKPWNNDQLLQAVNTALTLSRDIQPLIDPSTRARLDAEYDLGNLIGGDTAFLSALATAVRVAATDAPVLIEGESGTGKELIAEALHANSRRRNGPFVKVNLGGISASLFESEMFGHCKGAFTGATHDRLGRFALAHTGTIFLDEIGDLDQSSQVKLLRVLQDRTFEVLGRSRSQCSDFRAICATNRDLGGMVAAGRFREDLFYRVNLITVRVPPLRERTADIPRLVTFFIDNLKEIYGRDLSVAPDAIEWLKQPMWPGNVRELKNLVERTALITGKALLSADAFRAQLQPSPRRSSEMPMPPVGAMTLDEMELSMIQRALAVHGRNLSLVARSLGLSRGALYRRLDKYGLTV